MQHKKVIGCHAQLLALHIDTGLETLVSRLRHCWRTTHNATHMPSHKSLRLVTRHAIAPIIELNHSGRIVDAMELKQKLPSDIRLESQDYHALIESYAPRKLMLDWFLPYHDYIDMYHKSHAFRPQERICDAMSIYKEMQATGECPRTVHTYEALQRVQITCGTDEVLRSFESLNAALALPNQQPRYQNILHGLRACAILERIDVAEELYTFFMEHESSANAPIHLHNAMLDVYAEARSPFAFDFFERICRNYHPNADTFTSMTKACIFLDERKRLVRVREQMRLHGILDRELAPSILQEIVEASERYTQRATHNYKDDIMSDLRAEQSWGRLVDSRDIEFKKLLEPYLEKAKQERKQDE